MCASSTPLASADERVTEALLDTSGTQGIYRLQWPFDENLHWTFADILKKGSSS